ncbi:MAG: hypothetical protein FJZ10_00275 [Candidatus Omnitrophica bacterium]|nr:hypothetical protein [Candidatus Omnitrophota bacterium]
MKNKGLTMIEVLVVLLVAVSFLGIIIGVMLTGRNTWVKNATYVDLQQKARYAIDKISMELSQASPAQNFKVGDCIDEPLTGYPCLGDYLQFSIPVVTEDPVENSVYYQDGNIKYGAYGTTKGHQGWRITYLVSNSAPNRNRLIRFVPSEYVPPPTGKCCRCTGTSCCSVTIQSVCEDDLDGVWTAGATCSGTYPCGQNPTCFLAGTPILMADGSNKNIEDIKIGDKILAFDEKTNSLKEDKVSKFLEHDSKEYLVINDDLKVTANHPIYQAGEWIEIGKLKVGDKLLNFEGKPEEIKSIKLVKEPVKVYNFYVNPFHTYIAGRFRLAARDKSNPFEPPGHGGDVNLKNPLDFFKKLLNSLAFADDEIAIIANNIKDMQIENLITKVRITITAQGKTLLGETIDVPLTSTIYLRN